MLLLQPFEAFLKYLSLEHMNAEAVLELLHVLFKQSQSILSFFPEEAPHMERKMTLTALS